MLFYQGALTSMEPNEGTFVLHNENTKNTKPVHLVDVPGHFRLRSMLEDHFPRSATIFFVEDALEFLPNCQAASEYLYDILTNASVVKNKIPILLCCNKTDKVIAHTKEFIRKQMEKKIENSRFRGVRYQQLIYQMTSLSGLKETCLTFRIALTKSRSLSCLD